MEDIREIQRQKWLKAAEEKAKKAQEEKGQASSSASPSASAASGSGDASGYTAAPAPVANSAQNAPGSRSHPHSLQAAALSPTPEEQGELKSVRRLHILPIGPSADSSGEPRLQLLAPELRRIRNEQVKVCNGMFMKSSGHEFVVVKLDPDNGVLAPDTDYFVDGEYILRFNKVQFICLKDFQSPAETDDPSPLFSEYISPYFKSIAEDGKGRGNVVTIGDIVNIFDKEFKVMAAEPSEREIGIIDASTMVFVDWDSTPEFDKIHIVPFQDTLPGAYDFDVFQDYLKPYLSRNKHITLSANDTFTYQGVQFKVVCCEPNGPGWISSGGVTRVQCVRQVVMPRLSAWSALGTLQWVKMSANSHATTSSMWVVSMSGFVAAQIALFANAI